MQAGSTNPDRVQELQHWSSIRAPQYASKNHHSRRASQPLPVEAPERELDRHMGNKTLIRRGLILHYQQLATNSSPSGANQQGQHEP